MYDLARLIILLHVLSAFVYGAGYIGTNVMTELARRTVDPLELGHVLHFSNVLDKLNQFGGMAAGITGIAATFVFGYSLLTPWVIAASVLYAVIVVAGIVFWGRVGRETDRAMRAGELSRVIAILRSPRNIAASRLENALFVVLVSLMVLRPGA